MTTTAIVYASKLGNTRKTAKHAAVALNADTFDLSKQTAIDLSEYKHVIFGTGINAGKPYRSLVDFLADNSDQLAGKKKSLFICCMYAADKGKVQCTKVSEELGIPDAFFFAGKGDKDNNGIRKGVEEFIKEMLER